MKDIVNLTNIYSCFDFADATHNVDMCSSKNLTFSKLFEAVVGYPAAEMSIGLDLDWTGSGL